VSTSLTRWASHGLRVGPWRGDPHIAYLAPRPGASAPDASAVVDLRARLAGAGFGHAVTAALEPAEAEGFLAAGFEVREHLHVLSRSTAAALASSNDVPIRRARRADRNAVLAVDEVAFPAFWRLDRAGLDDALAATPTARFRLGTGPDDDGVVAYAIWGRAGTRGYLQRLAVDPEHRRAGYASALVADGLRWLRRRGSTTAVVNTQVDNGAALTLYERLGFARQGRLVVLEAELTP
jgi:ribosomal protein S18 acetylase RimI-like enzyme